jgi:putative ABC transport system substrate-binding protein
MRRREFIALVGGVVAWPAVARGQQPARVALIGYMSIGPEDEWRPSGGYFGVFVQELATYGRVEGKNIRIEYRAAESVERLPTVAAALVALKVDVILATSTPGARAARQATSTIPIVVPNMGDPIGDGLVASLAHPGGNITGTPERGNP